MGLCSLLGFVGSGSLFLALGSIFQVVQGLSPIIGLRACFSGLIGSGWRNDALLLQVDQLTYFTKWLSWLTDGWRIDGLPMDFLRIDLVSSIDNSQARTLDGFAGIRNVSSVPKRPFLTMTSACVFSGKCSLENHVRREGRRLSDVPGGASPESDRPVARKHRHVRFGAKTPEVQGQERLGLDVGLKRRQCFFFISASRDNFKRPRENVPSSDCWWRHLSAGNASRSWTFESSLCHFIPR